MLIAEALASACCASLTNFMRPLPAILAALLLALWPCTHAATYPLDTNSIDLRGYLGVVGGIPHYTNVWKSYTTNTTTAAILIDDLNNNVPQSTNGNVLLFAAGHYQLDAVLWGALNYTHGSYIALRGAGPGQTYFDFTNQTAQSGLFMVQGAGRQHESGPNPEWQTDTNMIRTVVSGYTRGSSNLVINLPGNVYGAPYDLAPGMIITLDQDNDPALGLNANGYDGSFAFAFQHLLRSTNKAQCEYHVVTAVNSLTNLVIHPPIMFPNYQAGLNPQIWWSGLPLTHIGFEGMTVNGSKATNISGSAHDNAFFVQNVTDVWFKDVEAIYCRKGLFSSYQTARGTVSHCFTHLPLYPTTSEGQYGCNPLFSSFWLVENSAWHGIATPINIDEGCTLSAFAYNFMTNDVFTLDPTFMAAGIQSHYYAAMGNTIEGNIAPGFNFDFIHGSSGTFNTAYRNLGYGLDPSIPSNSQNTYAFFVMGTNRYVSLAGNYMGTVGYPLNQTWYVTQANPSSPQRTEIRAGHYGNNQGFGQGDDATVTTLRVDGNYSTVASAVVWDAGDGSHTLPDVSRVYVGSSPPSWWTTYWTNTVPRYPSVDVLASPRTADSPIKLEIDNGTFGSTGGGTSGGGTSGGSTGGSSTPIVITGHVTLRGGVQLKVTP